MKIITKYLTIGFYILVYTILVITELIAQQTPSAMKKNYNEFWSIEKEIIQIGDTLMLSKIDTLRRDAAHSIVRKLIQALKLPGSYYYNFDSIKTISILRSPDDSFRVFTWYHIKDNGTYRHYGCFQRKNKKRLELYPLFDDSDFQPRPEQATTGAAGWFGALYYQIIKKTSSKGRTRYLLLGWDGNNFKTNKKVIDVVKFRGDSVVLGGPFFNVNNEKKHRVIFEYRKDAVFNLKYHDEDNMIIYDHLAPVFGDVKPEDLVLLDPDMYLPDGSYDGLKFEDGILNIYPKINPQSLKTPEPNYMKKRNVGK